MLPRRIATRVSGSFLSSVVVTYVPSAPVSRPKSSGRPLSLCAWVPYPVDSVPGQRFRIEQWKPYLEAEGIAADRVDRARHLAEPAHGVVHHHPDTGRDHGVDTGGPPLWRCSGLRARATTRVLDFSVIGAV